MPVIKRQALYELVWTKPVRDVAADFGLSDVGLKKICLRYDIPVPERGYWARLAAGKTVFKRKLPPRGPGMSDVIEIGPQPHRSYYKPTDAQIEDELAEPEPVEPAFDEAIESVETRVRALIGRVPNIRTLDDVCAPVRKLLDKDQERRAKQAASSYPSAYDAPFFDSPFEQRRLKIINSMFTAFNRAGMKPWISDKEARGLGVGVNGLSVNFDLDHPKATKDRWGQTKVHGGKVDTLKLEFRHRYDEPPADVWIDDETSKLENHLTEIVAALVLAAEIQYRKGALWSYKHAVERREELRQELAKRRAEAERKERERLAELERQRLERLLGYARDWRTAGDLRAFIAVVEERARAASQDVDVARWTAWARGVADRLDPLANFALITEEPDLHA